MLKPSLALYLHLDYRGVHYCRVMTDEIFGREGFLNEIIWAYDYGGKTSKRPPPRHDSILVYFKDREKYYFDSADFERIAYMAPKMAGAAKSERGSCPPTRGGTRSSRRRESENRLPDAETSRRSAPHRARLVGSSSISSLEVARPEWRRTSGSVSSYSLTRIPRQSR